MVNTNNHFCLTIITTNKCQWQYVSEWHSYHKTSLLKVLLTSAKPYKNNTDLCTTTRATTCTCYGEIDPIDSSRRLTARQCTLYDFSRQTLVEQIVQGPLPRRSRLRWFEIISKRLERFVVDYGVVVVYRIVHLYTSQPTTNATRIMCIGVNPGGLGSRSPDFEIGSHVGRGVSMKYYNVEECEVRTLSKEVTLQK